MGEELDISIEKEEIEDEIYEVCFEPRYNGEYYGVILFSEEGGVVGVGSLVYLIVGNKEERQVIFADNPKEENLLLISGDIIKDIQEKTFELEDGILGVFLILLVCLFLFLLFRKR